MPNGLPSTGDVRHAWGLAHGKTGSADYLNAVDRFDAWLARQLKLAQDHERARIAKGKP